MARNWDPNEWQTYCQELLTTHYGVQVQLVPDRDRGDGGLEAYVASLATAFQCYAPDNPFTVGSQTDAQMDKIRTDTKKLIDQPERTIRLIGQGNVINEWVLLTPAYESKRLVEYANTRASAILSKRDSNPWCGETFRISIHDDSLFPIAKAALFGIRRNELSIESDPIDVSRLRGIGQIPEGIEKVLNDKLIVDPRLAASPQMLERYLDANLRDYFRGSQELERLSREVPSVHRAANKCAEIVFDGLARYLAEADGRPIVVVGSIEDKLKDVLTTEVPGLRVDLVMLLARYFIASWWVQCPLQFDAAVDA